MEQDNPTFIIDTRLGIKVSWLEERGIIKAATIRQRASRGKLRYLQHGGGKGVESYIDFATMDEDLKSQVTAIIGSPYEKARNTIHLSQFITLDPNIPQFFDHYRTAKGAFLPDKVRAEYTANAYVLNGIRAMIETFQQKRIPLPFSTILEQVMNLDRQQYPFKLPENQRKLSDKYKEYIQGGLEVLIHTNYKTGSQNAAKIKGDIQEGVLLSIIGNAHNLNNEQCADLYNQMAEHCGWNRITAGAVAVWRKKNEYTIEASRKGAAAHRNGKAMTIPRSRPTAALYGWCLDGWDCELLYQEKKGKRTTYHNRLVVEMVIDLSTDYPIGYAIGDVEDAELITRALKNAIRHTQELTGSMLRPDQIQCDNFAMSAMRDTYQALAITAVTPAQVGNAKAKPIEPFFRRFNDEYCHKMMNWSGFGIKAKNQPNMDVILMNKKNFPTKEEVVAEISFLVNKCREDHRQAFLEKYAALPEDRKHPLELMTYLRLFGTERSQTVHLSAKGIELRLPEGRVQYDCFDTRFRDFCHVDWHIKEDEMDRTKVLAYTDSYTEQFILETKYIQPMALADRKPGDYEKLEQVLHFRKDEEQRITNRICAAQDTTRKVMESVANRELDMQMKFLIPDSKGQQKELRYQAERMIPEVTPFAAADEQAEEEFDIRDNY